MLALQTNARKPTAGLSLIEICLCIVVVAIVLVGVARAFSASLSAAEQARRNTDAAIFLETTMEDLSAQPYENLLSLNGNQVFDGADADHSNYSIALSTFLAEVDLIEVQAIVTDLRTKMPLGRVVALRSRR